MVAGDAFVVGDGLDIGQRAVGEVVGVDVDLAGTLAVGRALVVEGLGLVGGHVVGHGDDFELGFGQGAE